jgi:hypothetical protein
MTISIVGRLVEWQKASVDNRFGRGTEDFEIRAIILLFCSVIEWEEDERVSNERDGGGVSVWLRGFSLRLETEFSPH